MVLTLELLPQYLLVKIEDEPQQLIMHQARKWVRPLQLFQFPHREWEYRMEVVFNQQHPINMHLILVHMYIQCASNINEQ